MKSMKLLATMAIAAGMLAMSGCGRTVAVVPVPAPAPAPVVNPYPQPVVNPYPPVPVTPFIETEDILYANPAPISY